jgi:SNF2 family DNA or RNA helicase
VIKIELQSGGRPYVTLQSSSTTNAGAWSRLQEAMQRGVVGGNESRIDIRVDVFLAELSVVREVVRVYGQRVEFGDVIKAQIKLLFFDRQARESYLKSTSDGDIDLSDELLQAGFTRILKAFQVENLSKIMRLPHGADFSVPGAGKTTVALANFAINKHRKVVRRALVIAPLSAFSAWTEDSKECFKNHPPIICIHSGVDGLIPENTEILLTNYHRVVLDYDRIRAYVAEVPTQIFLDEAHRIKGGGSKVQGRAVLDLAYAAKRRDILTGTPAPQGAFDVVALLQFLYPGQDNQILPQETYVERNGRDSEVVFSTGNALQRYFVRTTKTELGLPKTRFIVEKRPMGALQQAIYDALVGRYRNSFQLEGSEKREFGRLGRILMYLLEAATNPMLLTAGSDKADSMTFSHPPLEVQGDEQLMDLLTNYGEYETPWKYSRVYEIVEEASRKNLKILVWSNFVRNLKGLHRYLEEFNPALIYGGTPATETPASIGSTTRNLQLEKFRNDPTCSVLLANPATLSEGVSLHHTCHHAIYVDRSFNAGHFLQSQDRIHRLGLDKHILTKYTLLLSEDSIDEGVGLRLEEKVDVLSRLMKDPGLVRLALPDPEGNGEIDAAFFNDDVLTLKSHLEGY